jgi:dUTP pyrophosphatase
MTQIKVKQLNENAVIPTRAHADDAGLDLYTPIDIILPPNQIVKIPLGIAIEIPTGFVGMICDRSSMALKGVKTLGGIIDAGYRGEIAAILTNVTSNTITLAAKTKIAQMLIMPVLLSPAVKVDLLSDSQRGDKGFGSTDTPNTNTQEETKEDTEEETSYIKRLFDEIFSS